ncbi:hypothetical protein MSMEI_3260 [Mycolicibacterium smegmatis MC2 155]|uniref:Uncharacterized protein n=1 Tax=Mycolicibacterium smegmatis (strain ATCC 700084 / mc(2)155) TaxID=246196 RepID=I7FLX3_MYCS2|nr:hypothetical protein MSMEI_3260 [Mycolicibacterium smegmatis MC2 155]
MVLAPFLVLAFPGLFDQQADAPDGSWKALGPISIPRRTRRSSVAATDVDPQAPIAVRGRFRLTRRYDRGIGVQRGLSMNRTAVRVGQATAAGALVAAGIGLGAYNALVVGAADRDSGPRGRTDHRAAAIATVRA